MPVKRMFDAVFGPRLHMTLSFVTGNDLKEIEDAVQENTDLMILESPASFTFRAVDHDLLMDIRSGVYQKEDHTFNSAFYDLLNGLEKRLDYAKEHTSLPEMPDLTRIKAFQMEVNERVVRDEI